MQNEVIEKKEKKPLSKKRIVAIVALSLVAVLLLVPIINQCIIELFNGELYEQDGLLQNSRVYVENVYVQDGAVHYTLVNDTIKEIRPWYPSAFSGEAVIEKYENGEWVKCELTGLPPLGEKHQQKDSPPPITVPAFSELERTYAYELMTFDLQEGEYRLLAGAQPYYSAITKAMDTFVHTISPIPVFIIKTAALPSFSVPVYFSIPAAS